MPSKKAGRLATPLSSDVLPLKKSVGAIHTSGSLTLVQRKLANVLLYNAYDSLVKRRTHTIPLPIMCAMLGWDGSNKIEHLKEALQALATTTIEFNLKEDGGKDVWRVMSMISFGEIKEGLCTYRYDEYLAERLYDPAIFAVINLQVQRNFDSGQALNRYENCVRFKDTQSGSTGWWTLEFIRNIIGAISSYYDDFRRLNSRAIKPAVEQINRDSDIVVTPELTKEGRIVVAIRFLVREKTPEELAEQEKRQRQLPGFTFRESVDQYAELRNTEAFKALRKHNIPERLAFAWIRDRGEASVLDLVSYVEVQDQNKKIKSTTSAYLVGLVKDGVEVGPSQYEEQKQAELVTATETAERKAAEAKLEDLRDSFQRERITARTKAMPLDEKRAYADTYLREIGQGSTTSWSAEAAAFTNSVERSRFTTWLRKTVAPAFDEAAFKAWAKSKRSAGQAQP